MADRGLRLPSSAMIPAQRIRKKGLEMGQRTTKALLTLEP
jgi:hypothetical protein